MKPSDINMISQIIPKSGTTIAQGLKHGKLGYIPKPGTTIAQGLKQSNPCTARTICERVRTAQGCCSRLKERFPANAHSLEN